MNPAFDKDYKNRVGKQLALQIAHCLKNNQLDQKQVAQASDFILSKIDAIADYQQLIVFLTELAQKWPVFNEILVLERAASQKEQEQLVSQKVENLAKEKKIAEALEITQTVPSDSH